MKGYCSFDKSRAKHEHCRCQNIYKDIHDCENNCSADFKCKGYSYLDSTSQCYLYTTSKCMKGCTKRNMGRLGNITEAKHNGGETGCFIKKESTIINNKYYKNCKTTIL